MAAGTLKEIGEALGLHGAAAVTELAGAASATQRAAFGWWYQDRVPKYPAVEAVKAHLVALAAAQGREDLLAEVYRLWR